MLQRDVNRHRRESSKWQVDRRRLEQELYKAKCDLENEDILDQLADNPSGNLSLFFSMSVINLNFSL